MPNWGQVNCQCALGQGCHPEWHVQAGLIGSLWNSGRTCVKSCSWEKISPELIQPASWRAALWERPWGSCWTVNGTWASNESWEHRQPMTAWMYEQRPGEVPVTPYSLDSDTTSSLGLLSTRQRLINCIRLSRGQQGGGGCSTWEKGLGELSLSRLEQSWFHGTWGNRGGLSTAMEDDRARDKNDISILMD